MINVAMDGPGGAGKSTAAKAVALRMGIHYVDTGAIYRGLGYYLTRQGIDVACEEQVAQALPALQASVEYTEEGQRILINGEDVTGNIRTPEAGNAASKVSVHGCVREKLLDLQRDLGRRYDVIMDGRDIGTVVLPNANLKIYITADAEERGRRRYKELLEKGHTDITLEQITEDIRERDHRDMNRAIAPLRQAEDARLLDTTHMTLEEVIDQICHWVEEVRSTQGWK